MLMQVPKFNIDSHIKLMTFVGWAAYGVIPTLHWTIMMGGLENPIVSVSYSYNYGEMGRDTFDNYL